MQAQPYEGRDPLGLVVSLNLKRRHLTASQRAMVALAIEETEAQLAKVRQGTRTDIVERIPQGDEGKARDKAAAAVDVNPRYVSDAKRIRDERPDLAKKVAAGEMNIPQAKRQIRRDNPPPPVQPPTGSYSVIYADPPWHWRSKKLKRNWPKSAKAPVLTLKKKFHKVTGERLATKPPLLWM